MDLIKRLREGRTEDSHLRWQVTDVHLEAAAALEAKDAEIEQLRAEITEWRQAAGVEASLRRDAHAEIANLRAALEKAVRCRRPALSRAKALQKQLTDV